MENYRIKIVSGIFAGYTGAIGAGFEFVDGVSVDELPTLAAQIISAEGDAYVVDADGEFVLNDAGNPYKVMPGAMPFADSVSVPAPLKRVSEVDGEEDDIETYLPQKSDLEFSGAGAEPTDEEPTTYTREHLEAIADKAGLRGLREVGDKFDVKGKSIPELIELIMTKCGEK